MSTKAIKWHLLPLEPFLQLNGVTEICINQPQEMFVETNGQFVRHQVLELESGFLESLAGLIAEFNHKEFPAPILSGSLPSGERIQFVMNPVCEANKIVCSIRCPQTRDLSLEDYEKSGAFEDAVNPDRTSIDDELTELLEQKNILSFLKKAILARKNILISGGTGTGKTTFLNACLKWVPLHERLITVEDTREVIVPHANAAHLLFNEEDERITALKVFKACLRLRPDRILLSELRGAEVWPFLRAANSGHPGSLSTVHADTPEGAITQLVFMMQQAGSTSSEERIRDYIQSIIPIVIQLERSSQPGRFMSVSDIYFNHRRKV